MSLTERFRDYRVRINTRKNYHIMEQARQLVDNTLSGQGRFVQIKRKLLIPTLQELKRRTPPIGYYVDLQIGRYLNATDQRTEALQYFERAVLTYPNPVTERENFDQFVDFYLVSVRDIAQKESIPFLSGRRRSEAIRNLELLAGSTHRVLEEHPDLDQVALENSAIVSWINSIKKRVTVQRSKFGRN